MTSWVGYVKYKDRTPFWIGNFQADGREKAKRAVRLGISAHLGGEDFRLLKIAQGSVSLQITGEIFDLDEEDQSL